MPQSLSKILIHLVFSTKNRADLIYPRDSAALYGYISGILNKLKSPALQIGGCADHIHALFALSRTITASDLVEDVKKSSSKWMTAERGIIEFQWQSGYGAFSISQSAEDDVRQYIVSQEEHHKKLSFQDELRKLLEKYRVVYDERYLWD
jgi:REP element-mobilizing transposase RayT